MSIIKVENATKTYPGTVALKEANLTLEENKIYGLLGRNGAGKTTLVNIITNRIFATSGRATIDGEPAKENDNAQSKVFCMTEKCGYPSDMRVLDGFLWARGFYNIDIDYALDLAAKFSLDLKKRIRALSTGYGGIFKAILTLASRAPVIIFDEPVLGLDANYRELFYKVLIEDYAENPRTIVIATHLIEEVADIVEHVIVVDGGEIIIDDDIETVLKKAYKVSGKGDAVAAFTAGKKVLKTENFGNFSAATVLGSLGETDKTEIKRAGLDVSRARLQELFVTLTDREGGAQ